MRRMNYGVTTVELDFAECLRVALLEPAGTLVTYTGPDGDGYITAVTIVGRPGCVIQEIGAGAVRQLSPLEMLAMCEEIR